MDYIELRNLYENINYKIRQYKDELNIKGIYALGSFMLGCMRKCNKVIDVSINYKNKKISRNEFINNLICRLSENKEESSIESIDK